MLAVVAVIVALATEAVANKGPRMKFSEAATEILVNPADALPEMSDIVFGNTPFTVTEKHIALLRKMRFAWETAETGAPMVDPDLPYATPDLIAAIGDRKGATIEADRAREHVEVYLALSKMLAHGSLKPGDYPLLNVRSEDIHVMMRGYFEDDTPLNDAPLGLTPDGLFRITAEHLELIKVLQFAWPDEEQASELVGRGDWPAPTMDPKRPYGDMSYFEADMAHILDLKVETKDGEKVLSEEQENAMQHLHWQMLGALQVFVENADFKPGTYK
jgi:hypothetical protein